MNKVIRILLVTLVVLLIIPIAIVRHNWQREGGEPVPIAVGQTKSYFPGDYYESVVTADRLARTYILHIPSGFSPSKKYPLVLVFHGGYGSGALMQRGTQFDAKADTKGFIVVYPDGIGHNWNDGRGTANPDIDDVGFIRQLIASLESRLPINASRIYATGASNGGMFSQRLGCELADTLAAVGPDIGPMPTNLLPTCKPARPIAVLGIQGGSDPLVPVGGGEVKSSRFIGLGKGGMVESAAATMGFWAAADGCDAKPTLVHEPPTVNDGTSLDRYTYSNCKGGAAVVYYIVQGMGHAWPPRLGQLPRISGATSHNINATDAMWDFFTIISR
jgi:polyhydroxybutyrate depolymerase